MKRKGITAFVLMIMLFLAGACAQKQDEQPGYAYKVYYINSDETAIFSSGPAISCSKIRRSIGILLL